MPSKKVAPAPKQSPAQEAKAAKSITGPALRVSRIRNDEPWSQPVRSYPADAGLDLTVCHFMTVAPGARALIAHNLAVALPEGSYGLVLGRSSTFHKKGLIVAPGIIDGGYRGEIMTVIYNPGQKSVYIGEGERVSQLLILPLNALQVVEVRGVEKLPKGDRAEAGFGSTGGLGLGDKTEP